MQQTISFEVAVERHEPSGAFVAKCNDFPGKVGIGLTAEEAVADLRAHVLRPVPPLPTVTGNPWHEVIGTWKDDPLMEEWRKAVEEYREAKDREEGIER